MIIFISLMIGGDFMGRKIIKYLLWCTPLIIILFILATETTQTLKKDRTYFEKRKEAVWEVSTKEKTIALTFDDGPDPIYTPQILDLLKKYKAKGTFFVIGKRVEEFPSIIQREAKEGHELANHTFNHRILRGYTKEKIELELEKTDEIIYSLTKKHPKLFRPPGGFYNENIVSVAKEKGYLVVIWSWRHDTLDWSRPGVKRIVNRVISNLHNGDIILLHDQVDNSQTVEALKLILPELKKRGYKLITVSQLLKKHS